MKKHLLRTGAMLLVSLFILTGCPQEPENGTTTNENQDTHETQDTEEKQDTGVKLKLEYDSSESKCQGIGEVVGTKYNFVKDEVVEITVSGRADKDIEKLDVRIVDGSKAANWWMEVVSYTTFTISDIKAGEPFKKTLKVTVNNTPMSKDDTKIVFYTESVKETVTLSELKYSFKKPEIPTYEDVEWNGNTYVIEAYEEFEFKEGEKEIDSRFMIDGDLYPGETKTWRADKYDINNPYRDNVSKKWIGPIKDNEILTLYAGRYGTDYLIKDGALEFYGYLSRKKINETDYDYERNFNILLSSDVKGKDLFIGDGSYIEVKFKTQKQNTWVFDIFAWERAASQPYSKFKNNDYPKAITSKGFNITELDFMEMTSVEDGLEANKVKPRGTIMFYDEDGEEQNGIEKTCTNNTWDEYSKTNDISGDEWFEQWHIFKAVVTKTSFTCWLDGNEYSNVTWEGLGEIGPEDYRLDISQDLEAVPFNSPVPWDTLGTKSLDFNSKIDYIKVGRIKN